MRFLRDIPRRTIPAAKHLTETGGKRYSGPGAVAARGK